MGQLDGKVAIAQDAEGRRRAFAPYLREQFEAESRRGDASCARSCRSRPPPGCAATRGR